MSKPFTVSKSGLEQFMSGCMHRYPLYRKYNLALMPPALAFGIEVHRLVEEGLPNPPSSDNLQAIEIASKLLRLTSKLGYKIIDREIQHLAPLTNDIQVVGRIDAVAELDGELVLIDFKTSGYGWKKRKTELGEIVYPKALGFQGPIYLTPPYGDDGSWPVELHYLLAPKQGKTAVHKFYENDEARQNLIRAATIMKDASDRGWFPQNRGWLCEGCDWAPACWKWNNWQRYYTERED